MMISYRDGFVWLVDDDSGDMACPTFTANPTFTTITASPTLRTRGYRYSGIFF